MAARPELPQTQVVQSAEALWGSPLSPAGCAACGQAFLVTSERMGQYCPNCGSPGIAEQPARLRPEPPELLIPFRLGKNEVATVLAGFVRGVRLAPDDFKVPNLLSRVVPSYWPMWLTDCDLQGDWQAEIGYDYQVKSSQESYGNGAWRTRELVETRIRWETRLGTIERHFDNVAVPATTLHSKYQDLVGGYKREQAADYTAEAIKQAILLIPDLAPDSAWPMAETSLKKAAGDQCQQAAQGQHVRNFVLHPEYRALNWTQLLQPVYTTYYTDDTGQPRMLYINGQSGSIGGLRLASQRKGWLWGGILAAIALGLFLLSALSFAFVALLPLLSVLGFIFGLAGLVLFVCALIPIIWPWQWNRQQEHPKVTTR